MASNFYNSCLMFQRKKFFEGNLYLRLYKSGYAVFIDHPLFGVGNKNYRVITTKNIEKK